MTPFATLFAGPAAALLLAANTPALASTAPAGVLPSVQLVCEGGPASGICRALAGALRAAAPGQVVTVRHTPPRTGAGGRISLRFVTEGHSENRLAGHLEWRSGDGSQGKGPTLEITVAGDVLNQALLGNFATQLVRHSALPL